MHRNPGMPPLAARAVGWAVALAALLVASVVALGVPSATASTQAGSAAASAKLVVTYQPTPDAAKQRWTLRCGPPGGTHPQPEEACERIAELDDPFAPVPPGTACAQEYGGPQTATVTGVLDGRQVDAAFDRRNSCQIARWDAHVPLIEPVSG